MFSIHICTLITFDDNWSHIQLYYKRYSYRKHNSFDHFNNCRIKPVSWILIQLIKEQFYNNVGINNFTMNQNRMATAKHQDFGIEWLITLEKGKWNYMVSRTDIWNTWIFERLFFHPYSRQTAKILSFWANSIEKKKVFASIFRFIVSRTWVWLFFFAYAMNRNNGTKPIYGTKAVCVRVLVCFFFRVLLIIFINRHCIHIIRILEGFFFFFQEKWVSCSKKNKTKKYELFRRGLNWNLGSEEKRQKILLRKHREGAERAQKI